MKSSAPSIVASTIHGDTGRRRRSFVSAVQSLAADVRGHVNGRGQTQKDDTLPPPPKIGQQIPSKAASILGRSIYSASRSVDCVSTTSMGARPRPSSSASTGSLGLAPSSRPIMTLRLSSTSFLNTTIADDLQCQQLYTIQTRGAQTTVSREDAVYGPSRVGSICWQTERNDERMQLPIKCDITVQMANGRRMALNDFLRSNKLLGSRKFNIPHYPYTLKWKRYGRTYSLTLSKMKKVVATLEPAVLSAPPRIRVFEPVYERDDTRPQLEHQGVPIPLLDYLVATSLLLLTDKDEWQHYGGAADTPSNNESGSNLPSFRSDSGSSSGAASNGVHSIHRWRTGVETEPFSSRPSTPALSTEDDVISLRTDESVSALQPRPISGHGRRESTADETASIPSFRSFYSDASVPSTIRPTPARPPPQQRLPEAVRSSTNSGTTVASMMHPFASANLNEEDDERDADEIATYTGKDAALGLPSFLEGIHSSNTIRIGQRSRDTDARTIRSPATTTPSPSTSSTPSSPQTRQTPPRPASASDVSEDRRALRPRPLPRPPASPPSMEIPPVPKLSPELLGLFSQSQSGASSSRRMVSSPLSSYFSDARNDTLPPSVAGPGPSTATHVVRPVLSQTLRRIASDTTISPVRMTPYVFDHSTRMDSSEAGPLPYKRPPLESHDIYNPYEDSAFSYAPSSSHHHDSYQTGHQGPLPLRVQNLSDNHRISDPLASPSADTDSVYHSLHSPPLYPHSPPENTYLSSQPPPAYDSIDFSYP